MSGKKVKTALFSMGLAFVLCLAGSGSASAQDMFWGFRPMPWQTYYSAPVYGAPAWTPTCPNGSCGVRQNQMAVPSNTAIYNAPPTYGAARPMFQQPPSVAQSKVTSPNSNRESPYYEYREAPSKAAPVKVGRPPQPANTVRDNNSPYYP